MSDRSISSALRRALRYVPDPGLDARLRDHALRVAQGGPPASHGPVRLRTVAASLVVLALLAGGAVKVVQNRAARLGSAGPAASVTPGTPSTSSPTLPAQVSPGGVVAAPTSTAAATATPTTASPTATSAVVDCQTGDLNSSVATGGTTFPVGARIDVSLVTANTSTKPCRLPPLCPSVYTVLDSTGKAVAHSPATASCATNQQRTTLQPGQTASAYISQWSTARSSSGSYTIQADWGGVARASEAITLTPGGAPPPSSASPSPTATPLLP